MGVPETQDAAFAMQAASTLVSQQLELSLGEELLGLIELYLAAHFLALTTSEGPLSAQTIGETGERYSNIYEPGLRATRFGQQAMLLDASGKLAELASRVEKPNLKSARFSVV